MNEIAPMECVEVLEVLSAYLDGDLDERVRSSVEAHLKTCDRCTRFGGEFGAIVKSLRQKLGADEELPAGVSERLANSLKR